MRQAYISRGSVQIESWPLYPSLTVVNETVAASDASSAALFDASLGVVFEYRNRGSTQAVVWGGDGLPDDGAREVTVAESGAISDATSVSGVWAGTVSESVAITDIRSALGALSGSVSESTAALDTATGTPNSATNFTVFVSEIVVAASSQSTASTAALAYTISNATRAGGTVTFTITLNRPSSETVTIGYRTKNGAKTSGVHYTAAASEWVFEPGEVVKTVVISAL